MDPHETHTVGYNGSETGCCSALLVMMEKGTASHMPKQLLCRWLNAVRTLHAPGPRRSAYVGVFHHVRVC